MKREMAKKARLIGKKCIVRATYINKPTWDIQKIGERPAWITGFGVIRRGTTSHDSYEGTAFHHSETIKVARVRFWPTGAEFPVPLDAYVLDDTAVPFLHSPEYVKECKECYRRNVEMYPRDGLGRFV